MDLQCYLPIPHRESFSAKNQTVNILGPEGHLLATIQLCLCRLKIVTDKKRKINGRVPIKLCASLEIGGKSSQRSLSISIIVESIFVLILEQEYKEDRLSKNMGIACSDLSSYHSVVKCTEKVNIHRRPVKHQLLLRNTRAHPTCSKGCQCSN